MPPSARSLKNIMSTGIMDFDDGAGSRMSHWSPRHPVTQRYSRSDHWAIMKNRAHSAGPASRPSHTAPAAVASGPPPPPKAFPQTVKPCSRCEYELKEGSTHSISQLVVKPSGPPDLLDMPTSHTPRKKSRTRVNLRTSLNERAKSGHKYWYQERPKPTNFGRYGIGSYKTQLGIGNAPRT